VRATHLTLSDQSLNDIILNCIEESFPKRGTVKLTVNLSPDLPRIPADSSRITRAFSELIENGISFMPNGGQLTIESSIVPSISSLRITGLSRSRKYVCVKFTDTGPGVPFEDKDRIFTPFYTSRAKGMGLGLSIVKGIIDAHHGGIIENGTEGVGASFVVYLPTTR
jgi:signal transduction histidine kinase